MPAAAVPPPSRAEPASGKNHPQPSGHQVPVLRLGGDLGRCFGLFGKGHGLDRMAVSIAQFGQSHAEAAPHHQLDFLRQGPLGLVEFHQLGFIDDLRNQGFAHG